MARIGIYTRLSEDRTGTQTATSRQEQACRDFAKARGWKVVDVYSDVDLSAFRRGVRRPDFERLLDDVTTGRVGGVLCWKLDRLVRSHADFERLWGVLEERGGLLASATEPVDSTSELGMIVVRLLVSFARLESVNIQLRTAAANQALAAQGRPHRGGQRGFGLTADWSAEVPREADALRDAARRIIDGETLGTIVREWNAAGITTATGRAWRTVSLRRTLCSPHVAAKRSYKGAIVADGTWPAILDEQTWARVTAILTDPTRDTGGGGPARYLLSGGLLRCGLCQAQMMSRPREDGARRYVCRRDEGVDGCGRIGVIAEPLEEMIVAATLDHLEEYGTITATPPAATGDATATLARITALEGQLRQLAVDHYRDRLIDRHEFMAARGAVQEEIASLRGRLRPRRVSPWGDGRPPVEVWADHDDPHWRRAALAHVIERIEVGPAVHGRNFFDPDRITIYWR